VGRAQRVIRSAPDYRQNSRRLTGAAHELRPQAQGFYSVRRAINGDQDFHGVFTSTSNLSERRNVAPGGRPKWAQNEQRPDITGFPDRLLDRNCSAQMRKSGKPKAIRQDSQDSQDGIRGKIL
jgi:hypothetical protein